MSYLQSVLLGLLQGLSELFPVSSLGHSVILPSVLHWQIDQASNAFLLFLVGTHFATAIVLFCFYLEDWKKMIAGFFRSLREREIRNEDTYAKLIWLLIVGTIPAGILGLLFEDRLKTLLAKATFVAVALFLNGILLYAAERLRRNKQDVASTQVDQRLAAVTWAQMVQIGLWQCLALIPGFSRTGATMTGGLLVGLSHEESARLSFLLATPIIGAAALLKLPELLSPSVYSSLGPILVGMASAAAAAYLTVRFLSSYFKTNNLTPFAIYCSLLGLGTLLLLNVR